MTVKLIMYWDIKPGKDQEYFEFVVREWVPATTQLGLRASGAWYTVYSRDKSLPRIMAEVLAEDLATIKRVLKSESWLNLHARLLEYVDNYTQKVVYVTGGFQL